MKKFVLLSAIAVVGLAGFSASAKISDGYESFKLKATAYIQGDDQITKVKITNKDLLDLVTNEFGALPDGAQLATYGWDGGDFVVLDKKGNYLEDVSHGEDDDYELLLSGEDEPIYSDKESKNKETGDFIIYGGYIQYNSADEDDSLEIGGFTKITDVATDKNDSLKESFTGKGWSGQFQLSGEDGRIEGYGKIFGHASGSGKNVEDPMFEYIY